MVYDARVRDTKENENKTILVTGFGPFGKHKVNASWEAVRLLPDYFKQEKINLEIRNLPVIYDHIVARYAPITGNTTGVEDEPDLKSKPDFIVNVGVFGKGIGGRPNKVTLERNGHNSSYVRKDINGMVPEDNCCVPGGPDILTTVLDIDSISREMNDDFKQGKGVVETWVSEDAGRFLCDFTYYKSLYESNGKALFVHVPELDSPYSAQDLSRSLATILTHVIKQTKMMD